MTSRAASGCIRVIAFAGILATLPVFSGRVAAGARTDSPEKLLFVGGHLSPDELVVLDCALEAGEKRVPFVLDSLTGSKYLSAFIAEYKPDRIVGLGNFPGGVEDVQTRLKMKFQQRIAWTQDLPEELWEFLCPHAEQVVICATEPRRLFLQAATLACILRVPLIPDPHTDLAKLLQRHKNWKISKVFAVGATGDYSAFGAANVTSLATEQSVTEACLQILHKRGAPHTVVFTNPTDEQQEFHGVSSLAPRLAAQRHASLLLTNESGEDVEELMRKVLRDKRLRGVENVVLVGNLDAIPMKRRPNPIPGGKDPYIEMEPLTPNGNDPYTFAVGRLFNQTGAVVTLQMAWQQLVEQRKETRSALVASNPGGSLPLLETFSRSTAQELQNAGYNTTTLVGKNLSKDSLRKAMPNCDVMLWEGHHNTLVKDWGFTTWDEPLPGTFVFLQSCLALQEEKAQPLIQRGAIAVAGSSTRTYSASGGAMSLAFFDAVLYDRLTAGAALRQAKNFLLLYSLLKEKRLGDAAQKLGANQRAAWSFTLWGDPTFTLPSPQTTSASRPPIKHEVKGDTISIQLPGKPLDPVKNYKYQVQVPPNARLAGLLRKEDSHNPDTLVPLVFVEVSLPRAPEDRVPKLKSKLSSRYYVFCWDERRKVGYLLAEPHSMQQQELRFQVSWESPIMDTVEVAEQE